MRIGDEIGRAYRSFAEAQVRARVAARFFAVVGEIRLRVKIGFIADDFDGIFIRAHGAVRAQAIKQALGLILVAERNFISHG